MKNPTATRGDDETLVPKEKVKIKSCLGFLLLTSGQPIPKVMTTGMSPLCVGIPIPRQQVSPSRFDDGQNLEWVSYNCLGFSTYLKQSGKEPLSDKQTTWKKPHCAGLWNYIGGFGAGPSDVVQTVYGAGPAVLHAVHVYSGSAKEGAQEVPK